MNDYIVLLFHTVDDREILSLRSLGNVQPEIFERLIRRLQNEFAIVSVDEIVACVAGGAERNGTALALSFDDGSKSYATNVVPILERFGIPSTCFLITDCIGDKTLYWRYLYNYCIHRGSARELADVLSAAYRTPLSVEEIVSFTRKNYSKEKNKEVINAIFRRIVSEEEYRSSEKDLFLSLEDMRILKSNSFVTFGIHTATHPVLMHLRDNEIHDEISRSLAFHRMNISQNIPMFSIPFGRLYKDYDERTIRIAHRLSIDTIFSAYGGGNSRGQHRYNIRRFPVHEESLAQGIETFVGSIRNCTIPQEYRAYEKRLNDALFQE